MCAKHIWPNSENRRRLDGDVTDTRESTFKRSAFTVAARELGHMARNDHT